MVKSISPQSLLWQQPNHHIDLYFISFLKKPCHRSGHHIDLLSFSITNTKQIKYSHESSISDKLAKLILPPSINLAFSVSSLLHLVALRNEAARDFFVAPPPVSPADFHDPLFHA